MRVPWKNCLKYALGFGVLAWVVATSWNPADDGSSPGIRSLLTRTPHVGPLVAGLFVGGLGVLITFVRWYVLVRAQELPFTLRQAIRMGLVGFYFNTLLPGSVGGDLYKAYAVAREQKRRAVAVATVIMDRAVGLWSLVWFVSLLGVLLTILEDPVLQNNPELQVVVRGSWWILAGTLAASMILAALPRRWAESGADRLERLPKVGHTLAEFLRAIWLYHQKLGAIGLGVLLSLASHGMYILAFHFASRIFAVDSETAQLGTLFEHFLIVPLGMVSQALPITPGGIGVGETAFQWLYLHILHKPMIHGFWSCFTHRVMNMTLGLVAFLIYLRIRVALPVSPHGGSVAELATAKDW